MKEEIENLKAQGFKGFKSVNELRKSLEGISNVKGIYVVLRLQDDAPEFVEQGTGGHFKKKNPNVAVEKLKTDWVDGTPIVYMGQTERDLKKRLGELIRFGQGEAVGHWGGRYLWQLKDAEKLIIAWKELTADDPKKIERDMLNTFKSTFNKLPFANLR